MVRKIDVFSVSFCISCAGLCLALITEQSIWALLLIAVLSAAIMLLYSQVAGKQGFDFINCIRLKCGKAITFLFAVFCIIAASSSAVLGSRLFSSSVFDGKGFIVLLLLTLAVAIYFALSKPVAKARVATMVFIVTAFFLTLTLLLALVKINSFTPDIQLEFKLSGFELLGVCVFDLVATLGLYKKENGMLAGALGGALPPIYFCITAISSTLILSKELLLNSDMPFLLVWKTTFIGEFISHFEVYAICVMLAATVVKSGLFLGLSVHAIGQKYSPIIYVAAVACAAGIGYIENWFFVYTFIALAFGLIVPIFLLIKK